MEVEESRKANGYYHIKELNKQLNKAKAKERKRLNETLNKQQKINNYQPIADKYNKPEINHIDANRTNNNVSNLEWVTRQENADHRVCINLNIINIKHCN